MEIKAQLKKPYTESQRTGFVVRYNHQLGYTINETETELQALGYTEEELKQIEAERISKLKLTKREVFLALYNSSGITPEQIKSGLTDISALIELEYANEYYRGNPLIDSIGNSLGYTKEDLDYLFEYKVLPNKLEGKNA